MRPAETRRDFTRRRFLTLAGSAAAGAVLYPLASPLRSARAQPPTSTPATPPTRVLIEALTLGPGDFTPSAAGAPGGGLVSAVLHASTPFTHIGVDWSGDTPAGAALGFEVRSSTDGGGWTPWEAVTVEALGRETPSGDTFGALVAAGRASSVQLRVAPGPGGAPPALGGVTVALLNTIDGPAIETVGALPAALPAALSIGGRTVFSREAWGADESLSLDTAGNEIWPRMYVPTKKAVVHHTATGNSYVNGVAEVQAIYTYHAVTLGWGDVGYSSLIDRDGNIYEVRHGRGEGETREVLSADVVAGHAVSHNYGSTGAALIGTHTRRGEGGKPGVVPTDASWAALTAVLAFECARRGIDPQGASDFLRSDDTWNMGLNDAGLDNIPGHRDCNPTICPGGHVYDRLGGLRVDVAAAVTNGGASVSGLTGPTGDPVTDGLASYDWTDDAPQFQYYLEGWQRLPGSEDIEYLRTDDYDPASGPAWPGGVPPATFDGLADGHYTLHVRAKNGSGVAGYEATHTLRMENGAMPPNTPPVVTIDAPADGDTFASGATINFTGTASDAEDGDLTGSIVWKLDGAEIGTGGTASASPDDGEHTITASVTDSGSLTTTDAITITVGGGSGGSGGNGWGRGGKPR